MGLLYDLYIGSKKKRCTECGCILVADVDADICELCVYERGETIPDHCREEGTY